MQIEKNIQKKWKELLGKDKAEVLIYELRNTDAHGGDIEKYIRKTNENHELGLNEEEIRKILFIFYENMKYHILYRAAEDMAPRDEQIGLHELSLSLKKLVNNFDEVSDNKKDLVSRLVDLLEEDPQEIEKNTVEITVILKDLGIVVGRQRGRVADMAENEESGNDVEIINSSLSKLKELLNKTVKK